MEAMGGWPMVAGLAVLFTLAVSVGTVFVIRRQPGSEYALQSKLESVERLVSKTREEYVPKRDCQCIADGGIGDIVEDLRKLVGQTREEMSGYAAKIEAYAGRLASVEMRLDRWIGEQQKSR